MAKFNQKTLEAKPTQNYEGGSAFEHLTPQNELYARISTWLVNEPKFYGNTTDEFNRIKHLIAEVGELEPELVLQLAAYARNTLHLRSAPIVLLVLSALQKTTRQYVREYTQSIVTRADEITESIAFLRDQIGPIGNEAEHTMMPHSLQKGLRLAFDNFDEYHFTKYDRDESEVSWKDAVYLVHPKSKDEKRNALYKKMLKDELGKADTWETHISGGTKGKSDTKSWEEALQKMPIMALLRNLRNLLDKEVSDKALETIVSKLTNEKIIQNSKQFPFRFYSAYKAIENNSNRNASKLLTALDAAMFISIKNLPLLTGVTAVFGDNSGSMDDPLSKNSEVKRMDVSSILCAIASVISPQSVTGAFGLTFKRINFSDKESILARTHKVRTTDVGHNTYGYLAIDYLTQHKIKVDRIFIFSDEQLYDENHTHSLYDSWEQYKKWINRNAYLYSFNLAGYGTTQVPESDPHVLTIAGWSESVLKYVPYFEQDRVTVLGEIRKITPATYLNKTKTQ